MTTVRGSFVGVCPVRWHFASLDAPWVPHTHALRARALALPRCWGWGFGGCMGNVRKLVNNFSSSSSFATFETGFGIAEDFCFSHKLQTLLSGQLMRCSEYLEHYHDAHHQSMSFHEMQCTLLKSAGNTGSEVRISPTGGRDGLLERF